MSNRAPRSRRVLSSENTSVFTKSTRDASSGFAARFSFATSSAGAELSIAVTRFAPPASAAMAKPPV